MVVTHNVTHAQRHPILTQFTCTNPKTHTTPRTKMIHMELPQSLSTCTPLFSLLKLAQAQSPAALLAYPAQQAA